MDVVTRERGLLRMGGECVCVSIGRGVEIMTCRTCRLITRVVQ